MMTGVSEAQAAQTIQSTVQNTTQSDQGAENSSFASLLAAQMEQGDGLQALGASGGGDASPDISAQSNFAGASGLFFGGNWLLSADLAEKIRQEDAAVADGSYFKKTAPEETAAETTQTVEETEALRALIEALQSEKEAAQTAEVAAAQSPQETTSGILDQAEMKQMILMLCMMLSSSMGLNNDDSKSGGLGGSSSSSSMLMSLANIMQAQQM